MEGKNFTVNFLISLLLDQNEIRLLLLFIFINIYYYYIIIILSVQNISKALYLNMRYW